MLLFFILKEVILDGCSFIRLIKILFLGILLYINPRNSKRFYSDIEFDSFAKLISSFNIPAEFLD